VSALSERAPLGAVPDVQVPANGEPVLMGRSSNSSDYQLPANRLISRVHVRASYQAPSATVVSGSITIECTGWNGCIIQSDGQLVELSKGETLIVKDPSAEIMVDVQDTRVLLLWPRSSEEETYTSPIKAVYLSPMRSSSVIDGLPPSSPPIMRLRSVSPVQTDFYHNIAATFDSTFVASQESRHSPDLVEVYEDLRSGEKMQSSENQPVSEFPADAAQSNKIINADVMVEVPNGPEDILENDEENDPSLSFQRPATRTPTPEIMNNCQESPRKRLKMSLDKDTITEDLPVVAVQPPPTGNIFRESPIKNHAINQLAFARALSTPLVTIYGNIPAGMKTAKSSDSEEEVLMTRNDLKNMLSRVECIGRISREGKDAAGKTLEDEFYYVPDFDQDELRKAAVVKSRPPIRNVRKQHKVSQLAYLVLYKI